MSSSSTDKIVNDAAAKADSKIKKKKKKSSKVTKLEDQQEKVFAPEDPFTDPSALIMGGLFDTIDSLIHIVLGLLFSFFIGWIGWHVSWVIFAIFIVWLWDRRHKRLGWERRFMFYMRDLKKHKLVAAEKESVEWLNLALRKFFPIYSPDITDSVEAAIIAAIEDAMAVPPSPVTGVEVQGVDLGVVPPQLEMIKSYNLPGNKYQMDCTLTYNSDMRIVVAAALGMGGLSVKIPVAVKDLTISGRLRIVIAMAAHPPLYKTVTVSFKHPPEVSIGLEPLKAFDLDKVPMLGDWLRQTIVTVISSMMVFPNSLPIELGAIRPPGEDHEVKEDANERAQGEIDPDAGTPMTSARAKKLSAQRQPEYVGRVKVTVVSAASLHAANKGGLLGKGLLGSKTVDAYAKLYCGADKKTTGTQKNTLSPEWNESYDFLVEKARKYQHVEVQVYDKDKVGRDDPLGFCKIDFSAIVTDQDSEEITYTEQLAGKGSTEDAKVTLKIRYISD